MPVHCNTGVIRVLRPHHTENAPLRGREARAAFSAGAQARTCEAKRAPSKRTSSRTWALKAHLLKDVHTENTTPRRPSHCKRTVSVLAGFGTNKRVSLGSHKRVSRSRSGRSVHLYQPFFFLLAGAQTRTCRARRARSSRRVKPTSSRTCTPAEKSAH